MARLSPLCGVLLVILFALCDPTSALRSNSGKPANAILLSNVKTLTLDSSKQTAHRRVSSIPQLQCVGGNARGLYEVDVMRCKNAGSGYDSEDIEWTCQAALPPEFKLGSTEVVCEGYESPEDSYVLKGSCGVEYRLVLTEKGEERYADRMGSGWGSGAGGEQKMGKLFTVLFWAAFVGIIGLIVYRFFYPDPAAAGPTRRNGYGGGNGWGGGDDNDDPPPPYTPRYNAPRKQQSSNRSYASSSRNANAAGGYQPGFWTGTAAGAAAAAGANYMMGGNRNANQQQQQQQQQAQAGPSNWFGGGAQRSPSYGSGGASSSNVTPSASRYESTGFGGTRRR